MDLKELKEQLAHTEQEFETALAQCHRCDGAIQMIQHLINEAETGVVSPPETFADSTVDNNPTQ